LGRPTNTQPIPVSNTTLPITEPSTPVPMLELLLIVVAVASIALVLTYLVIRKRKMADCDVMRHENTKNTLR